MYRVAVIDDEPWVISDIRNALDWKRYGFEIVIESFNPYEALQKVLEIKPHLILIDIIMPGLSGLDFIKRCHSEDLKPHFIIISAHDNFSYAKAAITLSVSEYLLKPIEKSELKFAVESIHEELEHKAYNINNSSSGELAEEVRYFNRMLAYINQNYCEDLNLSDLAKKFHFTNTYICDLFKKELNTTFTKYINDLRLKKSYQLITDTDYSISRIVLECGFCNCSYFAKLFREKYGITPNALRTHRSSI